jgi:hypothetical protein
MQSLVCRVLRDRLSVTLVPKCFFFFVRIVVYLLLIPPFSIGRSCDATFTRTWRVDPCGGSTEQADNRQRHTPRGIR